MRRIVHKQEIPIAEKFTVAMPQNAKVLKVEEQWEKVVIWYMFHPSDYENMHRHEFVMGVTGHEFNIPNDDTYVGTFMLDGGSFVGHLFHLGSVGAVFRDPTT